jgi:DNA-binding GntR family transcriptional regulator
VALLSQVHAPTRVTSTEQAHDAILAAILDGSLPPGTALPLKELSESLGMSMMPVREAIRRLEASGLVANEPHKGARVRSVSDEDLEDTYIARIEIEGALTALAAVRFDDDHARAARRALDEQHEAIGRDDLVAARNAHEEFHQAIYRAAGSSWLLRAIAPTWRNSERYRSPGMMAEPANIATRRAEHERILQSCIDRDPASARAALADHLLSTVRGLNPQAATRIESALARTAIG